MKTCMLFSISLFLLFTSCTKNVDDTVSVVKSPTISTLPGTVNKSLLLDLVNATRRQGCQCGDTYYYPVSSVTWNTQLELAAYNHSKDMYEKKYFSHIESDGSNGGVRIERTGYFWLAYGENIGTGYTTEKQVMEAWLKSPSHCKNIMGKDYKEMGVARVGTYWTQEFATK